MTDFNPLAGSILGSAQAQQQMDVQKQRQVRRVQALRKNAAAEGDRFEHQVESPEELAPVNEDPDDGPSQKDRRGGRHDGRKPKGEDRPHIDVKA
jgi:hypothetical protein